VTVQLENIDARPHPYGNRIDLSWKNPEPDVYPWVRVVRREGSFPVTYEDGQNVKEVDALLFSSDALVANSLDEGVLSLDLIQSGCRNIPSEGCRCKGRGGFEKMACDV